MPRKKTGKQEMGKGSQGCNLRGRPLSTGLMEVRVSSERKVLQVEGRVRGQVLRQKHEHCAGGKPRPDEWEETELGAGSSHEYITLVGAWAAPWWRQSTGDGST